MVKLLMIMQHITLCTPCIAFMLVSHTCIFVIDHAEQGHEERSQHKLRALTSSKNKTSPGVFNHHP
jgi:hypothetical protein